MLRRADTPAQFLADPVGRFVAGERYLVWCAAADLAGSSHWGNTTRQDAEELARLYQLFHHPGVAGTLDAFMDDRAMEGIDFEAYAVLECFVRENLIELRRRVRKQVVLIPTGPIGVALAGGHALAFSGGCMHFCADPGEGLTCLARDDGAAVLAEVDRLTAEARAIPFAVVRLRELLERVPTGMTLASAALDLEIPERTLQRTLARAGTSFRDERLRARVKWAAKLLEVTSDKVESIARRVGCSSASHLSVLFRRFEMKTPASYRAGQRS